MAQPDIARRISLHAVYSTAMSPGFQYSLSKMLRAKAWFAVICVAVAGLHRTQNDELIRDVYRARMIAYAVLGLLGAVLAAATLAFFVILHGSHRRLRLSMPEATAEED